MSTSSKNVNVYLKSGLWNVAVGNPGNSEYQSKNKAKALRVAAIVSVRENLGVAIFDTEGAFSIAQSRENAH